MFDVEKCVAVCAISTNELSNLDRSEVTLYKGEDDTYYLYGEGGPRTVFGNYDRAGDCWTSGSTVITLNRKEFDWVLDMMTNWNTVDNLDKVCMFDLFRAI